MRPSTFGSYTLPPIQAGTFVPSGSFIDSFSQSDEEDGIMPTMGLNPMLLGEGTIACTFMIGRGYLQAQGYDQDEGGLDTALYDFAVSVIAGGIQTLTFLPTGGTTPKQGLAGFALITSWECQAQVGSTYSSNRHVNNAQAYCEIPVTFVIGPGTWTVNTNAPASIPIPLI